jgi:small subunit ribosomal protein S1
MSENKPDETNDENQISFAAMLDSYSSGTKSEIQIGNRVQGKIISIGKDAVFVDTGTKIDGIVDKAELLDEDGRLPFNEGDMLELFVVALTEDEIRLSKALSGVGGLHLLKEAYAKGVPVEGKIRETCKGGFYVDVMHRKAFCPVSQMDLNYVENPAEYVGKTHRFLITQFENNGKNIVLSRRTLLAREQEASKKQYLETLRVGAVLEGKVTRLMPYGAFVELHPGVEGMIHISELSWSKLAAPDAVLRVDDTVAVKVVGIETGDKPGRVKIALSAKQLSEDPWIRVEDHLHEGDKLKGKVTRCVDFGAFIEIAPGIEGLVHLSEMSYKKRIVKPQEIVKEGEAVSVLIKEMDPVKRRIALSIKEAEGDPWIEVPEKYTVGQSTEGKVEKREKFGFFISLAPGITGLMPKSNFSRSSKATSIEKLKEGDTLMVVIEAIDLQGRKITLAPSDAKGEQNWEKYRDNAEASIGSLGEKLQQALASSKKLKTGRTGTKNPKVD